MRHRHDDIARGQEPSYRDRPYEPWGRQGYSMPTFGGMREPGPDAHWHRGSTMVEIGQPTRRARGPKGYVRSDERIREDVCDALGSDDWIDARQIEVEVKGGEVVLRGAVADRAMRQRAEDIAAAVRGVRDVTNDLLLRPHPPVIGPGDRAGGEDLVALERLRNLTDR